MQPTTDEMQAARQWAEEFIPGSGLEGPADVPFSFTFGGQRLHSTLPTWSRREASELCADFARRIVTHTDPATGLDVTVEANLHSDFPAVEWVLHLTNTGTEDTPILEAIRALDVELPLTMQEHCTVHYANGALCSVDDFAPRQRRMTPGAELHLQPGGGRSSSLVLPFLNLDLGDRGMVLGVGWTGEWAVQFNRGQDGKLRLQAGMAHTHLTLHPGETIRTPSILLLFWRDDRLRGHNMLRRFILKHHRPRPGGEPLIAPLCNGNWGGTPAEVHLDNVANIIEHELPFEYYWIDAEWFGGEGHWMEHAGNWTPREDLYPEGFTPISDRLHASGRKLLLWFEPERVAPGTPWAKTHEDWLLRVPDDKAVCWADYGEHLGTADWVRMESKRNQLGKGDRLLNLGNPDARRFLTDFLSDAIDRFGLDCLRQDSNIAQLEYWRHNDEPDRQGMTEIRYVEGQYALWDELLARHPGLIIDNCASGGRRIDLESISRSTPLWRTDYSVGHQDPAAIQCHTHGLLLWVPLNGTGGGYLKDWSRYELRSTMSAALTVGLWGFGDAPQEELPQEYPFVHAKELLEEYLSVRQYYYGDYYPLTEYSLAQDAWMAYQLDRPEEGDGLVVVLKRHQSPFTSADLPLRGLRAQASYEVTNIDTGERCVVPGAELMQAGLNVRLAGRPDSALLRYQALPEDAADDRSDRQD